MPIFPHVNKDCATGWAGMLRLCRVVIDPGPSRWLLLFGPGYAHAQEIPTEPGLRRGRCRRAPDSARRRAWRAARSVTSRGRRTPLLRRAPGPSVPAFRPRSHGRGKASLPLSQGNRRRPRHCRSPRCPLYGPLALPTGAEEEGPPGGLTLDMAIERLVHENISLRSRFLEIPKAQADSSRRASGPTRSSSPTPSRSLTATSPIAAPAARPNTTSTSLIRSTSTTSAGADRGAVRAKRVLEAQYQDAVRLEIDNLYTAFVDVLAARETLRYARGQRRRGWPAC